MRICKYCKKKLRPILNDHPEREYHVKCQELAKEDLKNVCLGLTYFLDSIYNSDTENKI